MQKINKKELYCKRDIWFNREHHDIELVDNHLSISTELGFTKLYESSVLVFKKGEIYKVSELYLGEYIGVYSDISKQEYFFKYLDSNKVLYLYSCFLDKKWIRKIKINILLKNNSNNESI